MYSEGREALRPCSGQAPVVRGEAAKAVQVIQPLTKTDAVPIVQLRSVQIVIVLSLLNLRRAEIARFENSQHSK